MRQENRDKIETMDNNSFTDIKQCEDCGWFRDGDCDNHLCDIYKKTNNERRPKGYKMNEQDGDDVEPDNIPFANGDVYYDPEKSPSYYGYSTRYFEYEDINGDKIERAQDGHYDSREY